MSTNANSLQPAVSSKELVTDNSLSSKDTKLKSKKDKDEICDDWEQLDQIQIKKSLQSIKLSQLNENEEKIIKNSRTSSGNNSTNISSSQFPFGGSNQMNNNPIKILKRPPSDKNLKDMNQAQANLNAQQPIKTFEQREQEYAQARLRILGSAHPDQDSNNANSNNSSISGSNTNINYIHKSNSHQNMTNNKQLILNNPNSNTYINNGPNNNNIKNNQYNNNPGNNLIRDPIGPDGSRGFNSNRYYNNYNQNNSNSNNYKYKS